MGRDRVQVGVHSGIEPTHQVDAQGQEGVRGAVHVDALAQVSGDSGGEEVLTLACVEATEDVLHGVVPSQLGVQ